MSTRADHRMKMARLADLNKTADGMYSAKLSRLTVEDAPQVAGAKVASKEIIGTLVVALVVVLSVLYLFSLDEQVLAGGLKTLF